jgi:hypothetical protein
LYLVGIFLLHISIFFLCSQVLAFELCYEMVLFFSDNDYLGFKILPLSILGNFRLWFH